MSGNVKRPGWLRLSVSPYPFRRIAADPAFHMNKEDLLKAMDPIRYVGRAPEQVEEYLDEVIEPILKENRELLGEKPQITV